MAGVGSSSSLGARARPQVEEDVLLPAWFELGREIADAEASWGTGRTAP